MVFSQTWDLQKILYTHLKGDQDLKTKVKERIFDTFTTSPVFPYVVVGLGTFYPWSTHTFKGTDHRFPVHIWSSYKGQKEVKEIAACIERALETLPRAGEGHCIVNIQQESLTLLADQDNQLVHGLLKLRFKTQAT